jgi:hypothetical protein
MTFPKIRKLVPGFVGIDEMGEMGEMTCLAIADG